MPEVRESSFEYFPREQVDEFCESVGVRSKRRRELTHRCLNEFARALVSEYLFETSKLETPLRRRTAAREATGRRPKARVGRPADARKRQIVGGLLGIWTELDVRVWAELDVRQIEGTGSSLPQAKKKKK